MNDQKNRSFPYPKWWRSDGGFRKNRRPSSKNTWLVVSASEWNASAIIPAEPVITAARNFSPVMIPFAINAPTTANIYLPLYPFSSEVIIFIPEIRQGGRDRL